MYTFVIPQTEEWLTRKTWWMLSITVKRSADQNLERRFVVLFHVNNHWVIGVIDFLAVPRSHDPVFSVPVYAILSH